MPMSKSTSFIGTVISILLGWIIGTFVVKAIDEPPVSRHLKCYSAGTLIYEGDSVGRIKGSSRVSEFYELNTNRHVYLIGDCVITRNQ